MWSYVGETGREVLARNSHSLAIVKGETKNYLVMFGGASPEHGTFRDTYIAELPDVESIGIEKKYFFFGIFDCNDA